MAWTPYLELSLEVPPLKCLNCLFDWRIYADKMMCWSRQKRASRSVRSEEKHIDLDLSTGEDQDLYFNVTTGGAQDEAKLLSKKYAWSSESTKIKRSRSDRKNLPRSLSRQQQIPETINSSRADFSRYKPTFSFKVARMFLSKTFQWVWLHEKAGLKFRCMW